ncbi:tRNA (adenosine(37)-N6)-dimethylallyltransferase MiaA [Alloscardovia venturai]|uniref:tRNA dimethylallyltransferase n=1 Tax=Alloscardovia venturai TaxID=1769421 RepID=A0ABW2Y3R5_9BIFI
MSCSTNYDDSHEAYEATTANLKVVSIIGPTASGKTALAINLAQHLESLTGVSCEIVNADAYQMYRRMDIGTAKASEQERAQIRHHLIDIVEPSDDMSVAKFQELARREIYNLQSRGIRPILVGGSGLYARAAIDDISFPGTDARLRTRIEEKAERVGQDALFEELASKDPEAASHMDARNVRRTIRALEVIELTGKPFSSTMPRYSYVIPTVQIGLDLSRDILDEKIEKRTTLMRQEGFTREVKELRGKLGKTASRALGYPQILSYLNGEISEDEAYEQIAQKTKRLARKQMGWFGRDPRVHWLNATDTDLVEQSCALVLRADRGEFDIFDEHADEYVQHHLGNVE